VKWNKGHMFWWICCQRQCPVIFIRHASPTCIALICCVVSLLITNINFYSLRPILLFANTHQRKVIWVTGSIIFFLSLVASILLTYLFMLTSHYSF
jgi:hypothetical protein